MTVAGSGAAGFEGDGHAAVDAALNDPSAVAVAHNGDVYVADTLNNRIRLISHATGLIRTIAGDGRSANDGSVGDQGPALRAQLSRPTGIALAPNGDLYVADAGHNRVRMINAASGLITTLAGTGIAGIAGDSGPAALASLDTPMGVALVPTANGVVVYVADSRNNRVRVIDAGGRITTLSGPWRLVAPTRIAYHPAGWLYVKDASPDGFTALAASQPLPRKATGAPARPAARKVT
jgi:DNA-binding beta-propeller fold protein YncE